MSKESFELCAQQTIRAELCLYTLRCGECQDKRFRTDHDLTIGVEFGRALELLGLKSKVGAWYVGTAYLSLVRSHSTSS